VTWRRRASAVAVGLALIAGGVIVIASAGSRTGVGGHPTVAF
jgi:hypothetical protein